jgi:hypothetical protein
VRGHGPARDLSQWELLVINGNGNPPALSWYAHPTYTPLPPAPSSLPWFRRATRLENAFYLREPPVSIFRDGPNISEKSLFVDEMPVCLMRSSAWAWMGAAATSREWLTHCKHAECVTGPVLS